MLETTPPDRVRRLLAAAALLAMTALLAACGGAATPSSGPTSAPSAAGTAEPAATAVPSTDATATGDPSTGSTDLLASLVPTEAISAALGETPSPDCKTSVLSGAASCVWMAADGAWLKVEDGVSQETPDLDAFVQRMTRTLGLDQAVDGLGQGAQLGTSSRGARIAVYRGDGQVLWVVINKAGDAATQSTQVKDLATTILAGL